MICPIEERRYQLISAAACVFKQKGSAEAAIRDIGRWRRGECLPQR
jgi:hypothetical protein